MVFVVLCRVLATMGDEGTEDTAALHARIFGSDDEDDLEVAPSPQPASGKKRLQKGAPSSSGASKKRRSAPDADEMAAAGAASEARRLEKKRKKEEARQRAASGEGGEGGEAGSSAAGGAGGGDDDDDPDEDSVDGDEAIEEGSKKDMDKYLKKSRGGKIELSLQQKKDDVDAMIERMEKAAELDDEALGKEPPQPAIYKAKMMPEVMVFMQKRHYHEVLVDGGMLQTLARWLKPTTDGSLVSLTVRSGLLKSLQYIEADETLIGALKSSKIGVFVKLLTMHRKETDDNKRMALSLVEKWSRPIFGSSVAFRSQEVEARMPRFSAADLAAQAEKAVKEAPANAEAPREHRSGITGRGTVVPRPLGMDFHVQPIGQAQARPSAKYAKDSTKGKLQDKLIGTQKRVSAQKQAETVSIEGRTMDRI